MNDPKKPSELFGTVFWLGFLMTFTVLAALLGPYLWEYLEDAAFWEASGFVLALMALAIFGGVAFKVICELLAGIVQRRFSPFELRALTLLVAWLVLYFLYKLQHIWE